MCCRGFEIFSGGTFFYPKRFGDGARKGYSARMICWSWDENCSHLSCVIASFSSLVFKQQELSSSSFCHPEKQKIPTAAS